METIAPEKEMNLSEHLEELRRRIVIALVAITLFSGISFFYSEKLMDLVIAPIQRNLDTLYFFTPYEAFLARVKLAIVSGIILSSPIIFLELWFFVSPGLYRKEKKLIFPMVFTSTALFFLGVLFAHFFVIPFALQFFMGFQTYSLLPLISLGSYLSFFMSFVLVFGLAFNLPMLLAGLVMLGVVGTPFLVAQRKVVIVLIFVLSAILTPTVDIFTQSILAIPLWLLFELSILIGRMIEKGKQKKVIPV
jgi:sec-independent protein translocase protein TatC